MSAPPFSSGPSGPGPGPRAFAQTVVEKIATAHRVDGSGAALRAGDWATIRPRHVLSHDNTAPTIAKFRAMGATRVHDPRQPVLALDHDIQERSPEHLEKYAAIATFAREHDVDFHRAGEGIGHQLIVERLYAAPGRFVVAADSHANTYGALGALGTPVVRADAAAIWATGTFSWQVPPTVRVVLDGRLPVGSTGKDLILALCGRYRDGEVLNAAVEFAGPGVATLSVDDRLTVANMTTEWGALAGWFPVDDVTRDWLAARRVALAADDGAAARADDAVRAAANPPRPDDGAAYAAEIVLDLSTVAPCVAGPRRVDAVAPLADVAARRIAIDKAYLLSCVNGRAADLAAAAAVLRGKRVADGVRLYVSAASAAAQRQAEAAGDWQALLDAGARPLPSGCGPCIGLGEGTLRPGEVAVSATNRNYPGRMGARDAKCWLAGPAVVAASALAGFLVGPAGPGGASAAADPAPTAPVPLKSALRRFATARTAEEGHEGGVPSLVAGFPRRVCGRLVWLPADDLDTDGIVDGEHTYRDDTVRDTLAEAVFHNYDPTLAARLAPGDVLVAGERFGIGSSREHAVTALQARGVAAVVAASVSRTYLRNAVNNGFLCLVCPELTGWLRQRYAAEIASGATAIVTDEPLAIDFRSGTMTFNRTSYAFPPLDPVVQALVADGGLIPRVRRLLGGGP